MGVEIEQAQAASGRRTHTACLTRCQRTLHSREHGCPDATARNAHRSSLLLDDGALLLQQLNALQVGGGGAPLGPAQPSMAAAGPPRALASAELLMGSAEPASGAATSPMASAEPVIGLPEPPMRSDGSRPRDWLSVLSGFCLRTGLPDILAVAQSRFRNEFRAI